MRTEVKIGLVICVLLVGIVIVTSLTGGDENTPADADANNTQVSNTEDSTTSHLPLLPDKNELPKPVRPVRTRPATSSTNNTVAAAKNSAPPKTAAPAVPLPGTTPALTRPQNTTTSTLPVRPQTPTIDPAASANAASKNSSVDYSVIRPKTTTEPAKPAITPVKPASLNLGSPSTTAPIKTPARPTPANTTITPAQPQKSRIYVVSQGDTGGYYGIAKKLYGSPRYAYLIRNANPDAESTRLRIGQKLRVPPIPEKARQTENPATTSGGKIHVVTEGDVAWDLAKKYYGAGKYLYLIERANRSVNLNNLKVGQKLIIPAKPAATATTGNDATAARADGQRTHTIAENDILGDISKKYYGTSRLWPAIKRANPGLDENYLVVGKKLTIPSRTQALKLLGITEDDLKKINDYRPAASSSQSSSSSTSSSSGNGYVDPKPLFE